LAADNYRNLQLNIEEIEVKNVKTLQNKLLMLITIMILRHSKLHMPEICSKICHIYAAYFRRIFCQILHIFPHILKKASHILRKFSTKNRHPYTVNITAM